jgi:hypothetical protein
MSILKGILHHWNKTTKSYDTIHPETESAQVTDWNQGIVNTLASKRHSYWQIEIHKFGSPLPCAPF